MKSPREDGYLPVVDLLRTFSILIVMAGHFRGFAPPAWGGEWWGQLQDNNAYGVTMFFVVSGFLITRLLDSQEGGLFRARYRPFYIRRVARLLPLLLVMVAVGMLFTFVIPGEGMQYLYCFHSIEERFGPRFWGSLVLFLYNWYQVLFPENIPGLFWGVLWSLSVEEQFYLFYPLLLRLLDRFGSWALWLGGIVIVGPFWRWLAVEKDPGHAAVALKASPGAFDQIAIGCLLYWVWKRLAPELRARRGIRTLFMTAGLALVAVCLFKTQLDGGWDLAYGPTCVAFGTFLFLLGGLESPLFSSPFWQPWILPGRFSYGLYLFHALIFYLGFPWLIRFPVYPAFILYFIVATILMGWVHRFFEVPANHWIRRRFSAQNP